MALWVYSVAVSLCKCTWRHCKFTVLLSHSVNVHEDIASLQCCCLTLSINVHEDIASLQCCCLTLSMYIMTMCVSSVAVSLYLHHDHNMCVSSVAVSLCLSASWPCVFPVLLSHFVYLHHDHVCFQCCCLTLSTSWKYYTCVFPVLLSHSIYIMTILYMCVSSVAVSLYLHHVHVNFQRCYSPSFLTKIKTTKFDQDCWIERLYSCTVFWKLAAKNAS